MRYNRDAVRIARRWSGNVSDESEGYPASVSDMRVQRMPDAIAYAKQQHSVFQMLIIVGPVASSRADTPSAVFRR